MFEPLPFASAPPSVVFLDTVSLCNARCPFCPLYQGDDTLRRDLHPQKLMDPALFDRIINELAALPVWPGVVFLGYLGETLLDRHFDDRLKTIVDAGFAKPIDILTNGAFLDETKARQIATANIGRVTIGFDGATEETYKKHRVGCDYRKVLGNIKRFAQIRDELKSQTRIVMQFVRTRDNVAEVKQAYEMFAEFLDPALDYFQDNISKDWASTPLVKSDLIVMHRPAERGRHGYCPKFATELVVHCDGKIAACCWDYNLDIAGSLGDINAASVLEVFHGPGRARVDAAMRSERLEDKPAKCRQCVFLYAPEDVSISESALDDLTLVTPNPFALIYHFPPKVEALSLSA